MSIWAIADLHLSFGVPDKTMEVFGPAWKSYQERLKNNWESLIKADDLILIPGDISWATTIRAAYTDLEWLDKLPGTKVLIKGNHDYWWKSLAKVREVLPKSIHVIQHDSFSWNEYTIGGARLWDSDEYNFDDCVNIPVKIESKVKVDSERIFSRELERLELSLKNFEDGADKRIVMTHFPPISADLIPSRVSFLLEKYGVDMCVFGHLHNLKMDKKLFGVHNGVRYVLVSSDYLNFVPFQLT